jgi:epoxide hydrolase-like predicted phosphatase
MIKAIIFDYGGVITSGGAGNELAIRLAQDLDISVDQVSELTFGPWPEYLKGHIDEEEYWRRAERQYGYSIPLDKRMIWNTWEHMSPIDKVLDFVKSLNSQGYIVGLLSNVIPNTEQDIRSHGVYDLFQPCILSCLAGFAKPEPEIYQVLLQQLPGVKVEEIIFIDDQDRCLKPARELGINCVMADKPDQVIAEVNSLLQQLR